MGSLPTAYGVRADVVWPGDLALPSRPPAVVYLDTFAYINLAKVAVGTAPPGYNDLFAACRQALADGRAIFPLSSTHILEIYNIASVAQRRDVVAVMEELSDFNFFLGRPQIMELEFEAALNDLPTMTIASQGHIPLVGTHMLHAFGKKGGILFEGATAEEASWWAEKLCQDMGIRAGTDPMASLNRWAMRQLVTGPDDHEDPALLQAGYSLDGWRDMLKKRAKRENDLVSKLDADPALRQSKLRDVVNANELYAELGHLVERAERATGLSLSQILEIQDPPTSECLAKVRNFIDGMPSTRVAASVKERYHSDSRHEWTTNDMQDIDALAIAVPYCDAVFIDKAARNQVVTSRELSVFRPDLPRRPADLVDWLTDLPTP
ncbi:hypothetical protein AN931_07995 [Mycobacterium intracellulare subsp. chimaera]|nr:hypothetical protein CE197_08790 [Mycobacterium intracellulare subsp. chimaera]KPN52575.1 hypothetical protein AN932_07605 [Mycobacterium intracellulare subsp. chimaera]KPN58871.1 hypothetical protein AN931_07995 [Mycobacterium intracellulare subsp. chimaera]ORV33723.1 hypothetical protein AWB97_08955 [Mycobacterium intracellulare subsp. chimaera]